MFIKATVIVLGLFNVTDKSASMSSMFIEVKK